MQQIQRIILGEVSPDQVDFDHLIQLTEQVSAESNDYLLLQQAVHIVLKHAVSQAHYLLRQYLHESDRKSQSRARNSEPFAYFK